MTNHPVKALGALLHRAASLHGERRYGECRRCNQLKDVLLIARGVLLASRPLRPHRADLAAHLRAVDEIDHALARPGYRPNRDLLSTHAATEQSALQADYLADLDSERALGFDGWIGHLDTKR